MHKTGVLHGANTSDEGGKGANNGDKAGKKDGFSTVFFEKLLGFVDVLLVNEGDIGVVDDFLSEKMTDPVIG
jgi:hypothetical protein